MPLKPTGSRLAANTCMHYVLYCKIYAGGNKNITTKVHTSSGFSMAYI